MMRGCTSARRVDHHAEAELCTARDLDYSEFTPRAVAEHAANGLTMRSRIAASSGLTPRLRMHFWPPLLNLGPWPCAPYSDSATSARTLETEYNALVTRNGEVSESLCTTIDADVPRTDGLNAAEQALLRSLLLAHCVLEPKWGYFQGMNDVARVVLAACTAAEAAPAELKPQQQIARQTEQQSEQPSEQRAQTPTPQLVPAQQEQMGQQQGQQGQPQRSGSKKLPNAGLAFWMLRGVLAHSSDNWNTSGLEGVWKQARAVRRILHKADRKLAMKIDQLDSTSASGGHANDDHPLAFLFGPIFLRLKREMLSLEETMRLWEICWARGRHFHVIVLAAFVRSQRSAILRVRGNGSGGELHMIFGRLHSSQLAAPLLAAARGLEVSARRLEASQRSSSHSVCCNSNGPRPRSMKRRRCWPPTVASCLTLA